MFDLNSFLTVYQKLDFFVLFILVILQDNYKICKGKSEPEFNVEFTKFEGKQNKEKHH